MHKFRLTPKENAAGYIIDVRENGGGNSNNGDRVSAVFIGENFTNQRALTRKHKIFDYFERLYRIPRNKYYVESILTIKISRLNIPGVLSAPLVVLSSSRTASAAENFLVNFDTTNRATIIGSASYGSTGQPIFINLKSGGRVRICTRWNTYPFRTHVFCHFIVVISNFTNIFKCKIRAYFLFLFH